MKAEVKVYPRPVLLDPQGKAIHEALERLGFKEVTEVRAGKTFEVEIKTRSVKKARARLEEMCGKLLVNPLMEDFSITFEDGES